MEESKNFDVIQKENENEDTLSFFIPYFYKYFENNQKEFVCTVSGIIRDNVLTINEKGKKPVHVTIDKLKEFEGSDNPWCVYDASKFDLSKVKKIDNVGDIYTFLTRRL